MFDRLSVLFILAVAATSALPASDKKPAENDLMAAIYSDCLKKDSMSCIKYKVFAFVDKMLADKEDITLSEGITVVKTGSTEEGAPRSIENTDVDTLLFDRLGRFLRTHSVKVDLKGSDILGAIESAGRSLEDITDDTNEEGRGKKKKAQKILGPIMMAVAMKAAALLPLALGAIALIAGKALLIGKIALVISSIIGLKKLLASKEKHVTYEVVAHPHHGGSSHLSHDDGGHGGFSSGGGGGGGGSDFGGYGSGGASSGHGWARSLPQDAHNLAYSAHQPEIKAETTK